MSRNKLESPQLDELFRAILTLNNSEECYEFFNDLCTIKELVSMGQRFEVARLLDQGLTFNEISEKTGAAPATITRVNRCLQYGEGYNIMLGRVKDDE